MCDDLIAKHYLHSAPSHITHRAAEGLTHYTLLPSQQVWVLASPDSTATPSELFTLRPRWTTVNSYSSSFATWAQEQGYQVHSLREMKLSVPKKPACELTPPDSPTSMSPPDSSTLPPAGFRAAPALSTKEWFLTAFPSRANIVHKAGEQVFSVSDVSRSIPKRAGWITVLPDAASGRCYISGMEVVEAHRRKGLARWLVQAVLRWWETAAPGGEVWLTAFEENLPALKLYEGLGFETVRPLWVAKRKVRRESDANAEPIH
jgi:ribosomal protein S18 acetylase RimI-like enzyme